MIKRTLTYICLLSVLITCIFSGCGSPEGCTQDPAATEDNPFSISIVEVIPGAFVDTAYDVSSLVTEEEGVKYTYKATYVDPENGTTKKLTVKSGKLTPKVEAEIQLVITAQKGKETAEATVIIPMGIVADAIDKLLASDGASGVADSGVTKVVNKDKQFIYGDTSTSSLSVSFTNPASETNGTALLDLSHYAMTAYYSDRTWKNAAVIFRVYNPMEQDIDFKLTSHDPKKLTTNFWDSETNTQIRTAKAGKWTQIVFSLYQLGIEKVLFSAPDGLREDSLKVLARYQGSGECKLYIDDVDVIPAETVEGLETGYVASKLPSGDFSDLLKSCKVYTNEHTAKLSPSTKGNGTKDSYCIGSDVTCGYPTFYIDFPQVTDISAFDYLMFDVFAENAYPYVTAAIRYIDENGEIQKHGTSYDYRMNEWRTLYVNLDFLQYADLTKAVGVCFSVHMDSRFVEGQYNTVYFDNVSLYQYPQDQPKLPAATVEDHDLISGPFYTSNTKPGTSGVCKVSADETGLSKSNSTLLFWTNNACGYPNVVATFMFEEEQDWSDKQMFTFESHQYHAHYWMSFTLIALDDDGNEVTYFYRHDTVLTNWQINNFPLNWFHLKDLNGETAKPENLKRVIGMKISVDLAVNITSEVCYIFFDNFEIS